MMDRVTRTEQVLRRVACWVVLVAVILSVWLFAAAEPWAWLLVSVLLIAGAGIWLLSVTTSLSPQLRAPGVLAFLAAAIVFVALQQARLAPAVVSSLNPRAMDFTEQSRELLSKVRADTPEETQADQAALSVSPAATQRTFYLFVAFACVYVVLSNTIRSWEQFRRVSLTLLVCGFVLAVVSTIHRFSGARELLWLQPPRYGGNIFGPFSNRNHYAAYVNMLFGLGLGMLLHARGRMEEGRDLQWRERLARLSSRHVSAVALSAFSLVVFGGSMSASLSRGGMLSLGCALGLFAAVLLTSKRTAPGTRRLVIGIVVLACVAFVWLGSGKAIDRIGSLADIARNPQEDSRMIVTKDTLAIFRAFPLFGSGFGTYRHIYPAFQTPSLASRWLHAHNDWAQLLAEGGVVGFALLAAAAAFWAASIRSHFANASRRARTVVTGCLVGLVTIAIHSLVDYSLHKPANVFLLGALAGLCTAGTHIRSRGVRSSRTSNKVPGKNEAGPGRRRLVWRVCALVLLVGLTSVGSGVLNALRGELAFQRFSYQGRIADDMPTPEKKGSVVGASLREVDLTLSYARQNADTLAELSTSLLRRSVDPELSRQLRLELVREASRCAMMAVETAPSDYLTWLVLARAMMTSGLWDETEMSLQRARDLVKKGEQVHMFRPAPRDRRSDVQVP